MEITVPPYHAVMGAIGAAIIAREERLAAGGETRFKGFSVSDTAYETTSFICSGCPNQCEIARLTLNGKTLACWGGRCEKWERFSEGESLPADEDGVPA